MLQYGVPATEIRDRRTISDFDYIVRDVIKRAASRRPTRAILFTRRKQAGIEGDDLPRVFSMDERIVLTIGTQDRGQCDGPARWRAIFRRTSASASRLIERLRSIGVRWTTSGSVRRSAARSTSVFVRLTPFGY